MKTQDSPQYHRLLQRQLRKYSTEELEKNDSFLQFVDSINESYKAYDRDKELSDHAYLLSQNEFDEINKKLKEEVILRSQSVEKLKQTLQSIKAEYKDINPSHSDDFFEIVQILDTEINARKEVENKLLKAIEEAEKASLAKSEFLSVMSHEIRTPLNAVIGMGHLLLKNSPREDQVENLKVLKISADNLLVLINNILDFNKIEAGKLELENASFGLRKLVQNLVIAHSNSADERGNSISLFIDEKIPDFFMGDYVRLGQILNNLVSNAIKFTRNGIISLSIELKELDSFRAKLFFSVKDTGVGIAPDKIQTVFSPFTQESSSTTRKFGGTGLGLTITRKILGQLGSNIEVESNLGKGSTFYFPLELELASPDEYAHTHQDQLYFDLQSKKILLVEDTQYNVFYAIQLLEGWNAQVEVAENGEIGVEKMKNGRFDLILMDLHMPVMDGYTSTQFIREFNKTIPIIALTASATNNVREKVLGIGMQDYVTKPFNPDDLFYKLKKYLG